MGLGNWLLKHGPGSPGDCAKALTKDYLKWKMEKPQASQDELFFLVMITRMTTRKTFGLSHLSAAECEEFIPQFDGKLSELIMCILCYEDDRIMMGNQFNYWNIEKIVEETVNKHLGGV